MQTRALVLQEKNERASYRNFELPELEDSEVLIKVSYSSLNYKDAISVLAKAQIAKSFPIVAGLDLSGIVVESKSRKFSKGDKVLVQGSGLGERCDGGFTEYGVFCDSIVIRLPETISEKQAMQIGTAGFTAALAISRLRKNDQDPEKGAILVTGASGGVGSFSLSFLKQLSYHTVAVSSKGFLQDKLKSLGADIVLTPDQIPHIDSPLGNICFGGAIDSLGGKHLSDILKQVETYGSVVSVGMVAGLEYSASILPHIIRGVSLLGVSSSNYPIEREEIFGMRYLKFIT